MALLLSVAEIQIGLQFGAVDGHLEI